jgi:hypothetical protein
VYVAAAAALEKQQIDQRLHAAMRKVGEKHNGTHNTRNSVSLGSGFRV